MNSHRTMIKYRLLYITLIGVVFVFIKLRYNVNVGSFRRHTDEFKDFNCDVNFAPFQSLPPVALISAPGSGNTWLRHLIEQATGIYTGSVFVDPELYDSGFLGEYDDWDSGRTIVVKTHTRNYHQMKRYPAAILLMRNAYTAIVTECNRMLTLQKHTTFVEWNSETVNSQEFEKVINDTMNWWEDVAVKWLLGYTRPLHVVHYEDLVLDTESQLINIVRFLNMTVSEERLKCVRRNMEGNFHKIRTVGDRAEELRALKGQRSRDIFQRMSKVSKLLAERGYKPLTTNIVFSGI
ncbi:sialate:O-sulfotransferase 1-like [Ptychodera flava]|uniref:sialate:O-sulfotransferase 1-like n=1 Tax=Ptychodera flava TaxID=63121 RepID=UPI00396A6357